MGSIVEIEGMLKGHTLNPFQRILRLETHIFYVKMDLLFVLHNSNKKNVDV